jgi:manganese-dependent inorganic pyrophosphatase
MNVSNLSVSQILNKDYKTYKVDDKLIGVGQILISDFKSIKNRSDEIVEYLNTLAKKDNYKVLTLFVTDVFDKESYCFYNEEAEDVIMNAFHPNKVYEGVKLDGILSRKAQIIPRIMEIVG